LVGFLIKLNAALANLICLESTYDPMRSFVKVLVLIGDTTRMYVFFLIGAKLVYYDCSKILNLLQRVR